MQSSSVDDLDLGDTPSNLSDEATIKIKMMEENRQHSSNRDSLRRQNIFILKASKFKKKYFRSNSKLIINSDSVINFKYK